LSEYGRRSVRKATGGLIAQDVIVAPGGDESIDYALAVGFGVSARAPNPWTGRQPAK
jgi:hypothetical protein